MKKIIQIEYVKTTNTNEINENICPFSNFMNLRNNSYS